MNLPALFLRIESAVILGAAVLTYAACGFNGWYFVLLFFTPDVSALGYAVNARVGAITYDSIHNFSLPLFVVALGICLHTNAMLAYGLIWTAHVAFDRLIGFGLMRPSWFGDSNVAVIDVVMLLRSITAKRRL